MFAELRVRCFRRDSPGGVKRCDATRVPHLEPVVVCRRLDARKKWNLPRRQVAFMQQGEHESDVAWTGRAEEK